MESVAERLDAVHARVAGACARGGRAPAGVEVLVVSKTVAAERVREAVEAGQRLFGESRQQEASAKIPLLPSSLQWHFIGPLQRNKVRKVLPLVEAIHSVDSVPLARQIDAVAAELGLFPKVFLEVNLAGEASKHGFTPEALRAALDELLRLPRLEVLGLMTVPPVAEDPQQSRPWFATLRTLRDELAHNAGVPITGLSMGMSDDFEVAVEEGATIIRVGSVVFGDRSIFEVEEQVAETVEGVFEGGPVAGFDRRCDGGERGIDGGAVGGCDVGGEQRFRAPPEAFGGSDQRGGR